VRERKGFRKCHDRAIGTEKEPKCLTKRKRSRTFGGSSKKRGRRRSSKYLPRVSENKNPGRYECEYGLVEQEATLAKGTGQKTVISRGETRTSNGTSKERQTGMGVSNDQKNTGKTTGASPRGAFLQVST